jgi:hypothetical protein
MNQTARRPASLAVATAKIVADKAANEVAIALYEVSGTRSAAKELNLDQVRWKYQHIGRAQPHRT